MYTSVKANFKKSDGQINIDKRRVTAHIVLQNIIFIPEKTIMIFDIDILTYL